ncbi:hypothetical protein D0N36_05565 [Hymenobacter lapidiphilus]|uniref:hypothetical protein n=1 Tax=Hymenobacter sp. CCM 8763 TaxID=2303334 RepID=UPI000E34B822|nr:hypothetical protein [Hymenobacter sp. CCM 8763]RFP66184.1 hypothetical protein D0N36_05565 [Hymenobacter sp. CCM 8763]
MRFRSILLLVLPGLLAACEPGLGSGPRVQFVADSRLTATARRLTTPADTVTTRIYARAEGDNLLQRLLITVTYEPKPEPITYSVLAEKEPPEDIVYLDSAVSSLKELVFQSTQPTRSTAGAETWRYEAFDAENRKGARSLRLYLPRADSLAVFHSYSVTLDAPRAGVSDTRRFLALREGLALPGFSVRNLPANQQRIDLIYQIDNAASAPVLSLPTEESLKLTWPQRRATQIRSTSLDSIAFQNAGTTALLRSAYDSGLGFARPATTGTLRQGQVVAFLTPEGKPGLLRVQRIGTTNRRQLTIQVRVGK